MKKYEVVSLAVNGSNKVHRLGEKVTDAHFPRGRAEELCQAGHLKEVSRQKVDTNNDGVEDTVSVIKESLKIISLEDAKVLLEKEKNGKNRISAVEAIEAKIAELEA